MKIENKREIEVFIKRKLSEMLDIDVEEIKNTDNLIDFGATSMIIVQLYIYIQEEYHVHLDNDLDLYKNYISIDEIIDGIEREVKENE